MSGTKYGMPSVLWCTQALMELWTMLNPTDGAAQPLLRSTTDRLPTLAHAACLSCFVLNTSVLGGSAASTPSRLPPPTHATGDTAHADSTAAPMHNCPHRFVARRP
jgi:hypothetical protein